MKTPTWQKHSEEPWVIDPLKIGTPWNIEADNEAVALVLDRPGDKLKEERTANTDRIVQCVNTLKGIQHPEKAIPALIDVLKEILKKEDFGDSIDEDMEYGLRDQIKQALKNCGEERQ